MMSLVSGRRFIAHLLEVSGMWTSGFIANPQAAHFDAGMRHMGLLLWKGLKTWCPDDLTKLLVEYNNAEPIEESGEPKSFDD